MTPSSLEEFAALARSRRTNLFVDRDREVPAALVEQLCEIGQWAPCHKRTWPAQYRLLSGDARAQLGKVAAAAMEARGDEPARVAKTLAKYLRTPAMLVVGAAPGDSPLRSAENRDATAAAVQNILLAATAAGLASFWSSCPKGANEAVASYCELEAGSHVVGLVYLGWPAAEVEAPARPAPDFRHFT
jgi:nitroreductase